MMLHAGLDSGQLVEMLRQALYKQNQSWKPIYFMGAPLQQVCSVGPSHRAEIVQWLSKLNETFRFYPETLALSVTILDRFLQTVKVRPKYLRCIAVSCFYLAAKTSEEDEVIPSVRDLVDRSECGCNVAEVLRMERIILDKLQWKLDTVTPLHFVHILHALLLCKCPHLLDAYPQMSPSRQLSVLTRKLQLCLADHRLNAYPPATLALALVSLELELFKPDWLTYTLTVQQMTTVDNEQLIGCREIMSRHLSSCPWVFISYHPVIRTPIKPGKRKVDQLSDDEEDDIYACLKRLYNDDPVAEVTVAVMSSCGSEMHQDTTDCSPFQSVAAN